MEDCDCAHDTQARGSLRCDGRNHNILPDSDPLQAAAHWTSPQTAPLGLSAGSTVRFAIDLLHILGHLEQISLKLHNFLRRHVGLHPRFCRVIAYMYRTIHQPSAFFLRLCRRNGCRVYPYLRQMPYYLVTIQIGVWPRAS